MNESDVRAISRKRGVRRTIPLFVALLLVSCFALWCGCWHNPRTVEERPPAGKQTIYVHVGFDFIQSPLEGRTISGGDVTNGLNIAARMTTDATGSGSYRGSLRIFRHLDNDAKLLIIADCTYDPEAELLEMNPFCAYLRYPAAVSSNAAPLFSGATQTRQLRCLRWCFRINGVRESDAMTSPATSSRLGTGVRLMPKAGIEEGREWFFSIETSSRGHMSSDPGSMWGDLPVGENDTGMGYLMIDSRLPEVTAPRPRTGATMTSGVGPPVFASGFAQARQVTLERQRLTTEE